MILQDQHGRAFGYARIALIDHCNLRCNYCMPENGLTWIKKDQGWQSNEVEKLLQLLKDWGIEKLRFTGGEPMVRSDFSDMISFAHSLEFKHIGVTTNGTLIQDVQDSFTSGQIHKANVSLDTIDSNRFIKITRRDHFQKVWDNIQWLSDNQIPFRINTVLLGDTTEEELMSMIALAYRNQWDWCFIEEMPFNGQGTEPNRKWTPHRFHSLIQEHQKELSPMPFQPGDTAQYFEWPGGGRIGFIAAWSRTFCGTCNRLRITPEGHLHYCLYSNKAFPILNKIRSGLNDAQLLMEVQSFLLNKPLTGIESEKESNEHLPSMAKIGG
ncbi:MAG: hypothetical protein RL609_1997 [Bacteroidota bacterium]|jgi:cyclic pyranopterin phosphate synthase